MARYAGYVRRQTLFRLSKKLPRLRPGLPRLPHPLPIDMVRVAQWFHALSDTMRLGMLEFLSQRERCVSELHQLLDVPQSSVSFHLKVLRESGLIRARRDGHWKYYGLNGETLNDLVAFIQVVMPGKHAGTCPLSCCR